MQEGGERNKPWDFECHSVALNKAGSILGILKTNCLETYYTSQKRENTSTDIPKSREQKQKN